MKIILVVCVLLNLYANSSFKKELYKKDIKLKIINVNDNDTLNLRNKSNINSKIIANLKNSTKNIITLGNTECSKWIKVSYNNNEGWLYNKYIENLNKYKIYNFHNINIEYPYYLIKKIINDKVELTHKTKFNHYREDSGVYTPTGYEEIKKDYIEDFNLKISFYNSFDSAIKHNTILSTYNYHKYQYSKDDPIQKYEYGYKVRTGIEGYYTDYYLINTNNYTLLMENNYNDNKIIELSKNSCIPISKKEKEIIINNIINSIK